jgi:glycosyltransferase involved in cell wall biosynthesis
MRLSNGRSGKLCDCSVLMAPRVSVIIPAYNACESLGETLDSVIAQTYGDWEVIVADDCSTDGTADLAANYHPRISCVRSPQNLGTGGARNLALAKAAGELVALLDDDDVWMPGYLQRQLACYDEAVAAGKRVGIVCCGTIPFGSEGSGDCVYSRDPVTLAALLRRNSIYTSALVPRALMVQLGGFATDCLGSEDYDLWLRILETGHTVVAVDEPLTFYRVGDGRISTDAVVMARAMQMTYQHALGRGRLNIRQRAIARRQLRLQRLIELHGHVARRRARTGQLPMSVLLRSTPLVVRVVCERPKLWLRGPRLVAASIRRLTATVARSLAT